MMKHIFSISSYFFFLLCGFAAAGEDSKVESDKSSKVTNIPEVKEEFDKYIQSLESIVKTYTKTLDSEEEIQTKKGNLDVLESIKHEREKITEKDKEPASSGAAWDKAKQKTLFTAQKNYNDAITKSKKGYVAKLESIQKKMVQDKKIDEAKLIRDYIEDLKNEEIKRMFVGTWKFENGVTQIFSIDGKATCNQYIGSWCISDNKIIVKWSDKTDSYNLPICNNSLTLKNSEGKTIKAIKISE